MSAIKLRINTPTQDFVRYLNNVPEKTQMIINAEIPKVRRQTKSTVQAHAPVDRGTYRRSFTINNFAKSKWEIGYEVYAKAPHYRLSHLLEGSETKTYAHILKQFRWGVGERTRRGNIGMVTVGTSPKREHLIYGQEYAADEIEKLYDKAIEMGMEK